MTSRGKTFGIGVLTAIASAAAFWLLREHWVHVLGYAPYLLFLACPLMHLFHGHGGHRPGRMSEPSQSPAPSDAGGGHAGW